MFCLYSFMMAHKAMIEMLANIGVVIAVLFSGWALLYSARAAKLQTEAINLERNSIDIQIKSLKAGIFNDILRGINEIINQEPSSKDNKKERWFCNLYNAFELYAFYANRFYIDSEMARYLKGFIGTYNGRVKDCPALVEMFKTDQSPDEYKELRKLCPDLPF